MASAEIYQVTQFRGLNASTTAAEIAENQASVCQNLYLWPDGTKLVVRGGQDPIASSLGAVDSDLLSWQKLGSTEYLLHVWGSSLRNAFTNTSYQLSGTTNPFPASGETNCAWFDRRVVLGNGVDKNVRFKPDESQPLAVVGVGPCTGTPTVVTNITGPHPAGTYEYCITYQGIDGDYGEAGGIVSTGELFTTYQLSVQSIPLITPGTDGVARMIWRRSGGNTTFRLAKILPAASGAVTVWIDDVADSDLGEELDEGRTRFPPCRYFTEWKSRLVGAGNAASGQQFYISDVLDPAVARALTDEDVDTQGGTFQLNGPAAGTITGLTVYGSTLVIFTGGAMYLMIGDRAANFDDNLFVNHGAVSHRAIVSTREGIYWASADGIYRWAGGPVERISDDVKPLYQAIAASGLARSSAFVYDGRLFFSWPAGCLVYDLAQQAWTENTAWTYRGTAISTFTATALPRVWGTRASSGWVWQMETGTDDNGAAIPVSYQSKDWDLGVPLHRKRIHSYGGLIATGTGTVSGQLFKNTSETATHTKAADMDQDGSVFRFRQRAPEQALSEHFRVGFSTLTSGGTFAILAMNLEWFDAGRE